MPPKSAKKTPKVKESKSESQKRSPGKQDGKTAVEQKQYLQTKSVEETEAIINDVFARQRYDTMYPAFKRSNGFMVLLSKNIHVWEVCSHFPLAQQFSNSNRVKKDKLVPNISLDPAAHAAVHIADASDECLLEGVVYFRPKSLTVHEKVFVEIYCNFVYNSYRTEANADPPEVTVTNRMFRSVQQIYPIDFDEDFTETFFNQYLVNKCRNELPKGYDGYSFSFDMKQCPVSVGLLRPGFGDQWRSGMFWTVRAYVADHESFAAKVDHELSMEFCKYTIAPLSQNLIKTPNQSYQYARHQTSKDAGYICINGNLENDVIHHGQELTVKLKIDNGSSRTTITNITIYIEQIVKLQQEVINQFVLELDVMDLCQDSSMCLPINPRSGTWSRTILLRPEFDFTIPNLAYDGMVARENRFLLASSTILIQHTPKSTDTETLLKAEPVKEEEERCSSGKAKPSDKSNSRKKGSKSVTKPKVEQKSDSKEKRTINDSQKPIPLSEDIVTNKANVALKSNIKLRPPAISVAYNVVARLNIHNADNNESGHPYLKMPFIITRETDKLDRWSNDSYYRRKINYFRYHS